MLIAGDISGIQDFLFDVREAGGGQARGLRYRSFRIQLIALSAAVRLLRALQWPQRSLLYCTAGKFVIEGEGPAETIAPLLSREGGDIERWLLQQTHGRLRLALAASSDAQAAPAAQYAQAMGALQRAKRRAWSSAAVGADGWKTDALVVSPAWDEDREGERDRDLGRRLVNADRLVIEADSTEGGDGAVSVLGLGARLCGNAPTSVPPLWSQDLRTLARHVPVDGRGQAIEFMQIAQAARGASMLGVLKADGDSLGLTISRVLQESRDLSPLRHLSAELDGFFAEKLDRAMRQPNSPWSNLYVVFSGGDDLLAVGPWDTVLDFAAWMRAEFTASFRARGLTISAGVALVKPKFPIRLGAQQADDLLEQAKRECAPGATEPKDQMAAFGQLWKWQDHAAIVDVGKRLSDWVDAGAIKRAWLRTLLELALLRRGELRQAKGAAPAMASSRLAYHLRNWPRSDDRDATRAAARAWVEGIRTEFDAVHEAASPCVKYLPAIVRYAMLATRSPESGEEL